MPSSAIALLFILAGSVGLSALTTIQYVILGHDIPPQAFLLPFAMGGLLGFSCFVWYRQSSLFKAKLVHLNLVLKTIRNVNHLLTQEKDRDRLVQGICDNLVENRGYHNAWIALVNEQGKWHSFFESGLGEEFSRISDRLKKGRLIACCQQALSQAGIVATDEPTTLCSGCPLAGTYEDTSAISSRLEYNGRIYGVMTLCIEKALVSDHEEQKLAAEIASDIAFGIHNIDLQTEREQNRAELIKNEARFRNLVENSLTGISIVQNNEVIYQNKEQERLLGPLPRSYILGDYGNIHPEDMEKVKRLSHDIASGKIQSLDVEFRYTPAVDNSSSIWIHCRAHAIEYRQKDSILVNMMDMSQIKKLENLLRLQDKMASLGRVTAGIAHEIRNPLSGINIYANTLKKYLRRGEQTEKIQAVIKNIQSASMKIEAIIRRVMDFSKPSAPKFVVDDINPLVEEAIKLTAVTVRKSGIELEKSLSRHLPKCRFDRTQIEEVILNLINNASDAMRKSNVEKKILVSTATDGGDVTVRVLDSGPGLKDEYRDKVFDPFFTTKPDSTGIGLSICHRIIADHGGTISVHTSRWGGAEFCITIPAADQ